MASIGSESPPRKKLRQARLPFQVISSPRTDAEKGGPGVKRKLSESDDIQITKVVKSGRAEEIKENTVQDGLKSDVKKMLSSLLTSKIINKCTENAEEDPKEESPSQTDSDLDSEQVISNTGESKQKKALSKIALDKLASWKKTSSPPRKTELVPAKDSISETDKMTNSAEEKTRDILSPKEIEKDNITGDSETSEIHSEAQCKPDSGSLSETSDVEEVSCDDSTANLSKTVESPEKTEDANQTLNQSCNSSIMEVDLDVECSEEAKNDGDSNEHVDTATPEVLAGNVTASPRTPKAVAGVAKSKLTPKQLARMKEAARKQEEKERLKQEKERKRQEELEEKVRAKQEKEEQKRKEKEEKEEQKRKEKEEKEKKRQAEIDLKNEEKRRREEQKAEEKRKKEDEKRKAEKDEVRKMAKESAMFTSFFVPKTSKAVEKETPAVQNFMPFEVKSDMRVAPCTRDHLDSSRLQYLDEVLQSKKEFSTAELYLAQVKRGSIKIGRSGRTWLREETKDEDVTILEPDSEGVFIEQPKLERMRAKFLQFHENFRPAYYGTWRKKSKTITGRTPTALDNIFDYDVDSADEWEEEEPGESLHGSDDEKEKESEDEYEVDNSVFVPHGYLSDDEGDAEIDEETLNPEMQKAKLKILGEEFENQMKTKTEVLKPVVILLTAAMQSAKLPGSSRYQILANRRAVWREEEGPVNVSCRIESSDTVGASPLAQRLDADGATYSGSRGIKKDLVEEAIPALITLLHGSPIKGSFLVNEFYEFLKRQSQISEEVSESTSSDSGKVWPRFAPASKASIARKLKELASWDLCNEDGPMKGKRCWVVPQEVREKYGVADLTLPNRWKFILKRTRAEKTPVAGVSPSASEAGVGSVEASTSTAKKCLITNFTKVMTAEEKQLDWERMKKSPPSKKTVSAKPPHGKITAFGSLFPASSTPSSQSSPSTASPVQVKSGTASPAPTVKKRVALLVSVPRGQDIPRAVEADRTTNSNAFTTANNAAAHAETPLTKIEEPKPLSSEEPKSSTRELPKSSNNENKSPEVIHLD